ncbi:glycosyltransferase family 2 protein, partial [Streptomyces daliensis]|nr:glycosyltransferase family 2 protein [Streptomyces daliensis]
MNRPLKVSVVVPTYNTGRTVLDGLRSLREQSMDREDFEVIYVDDGSTDDTAALLESALADEPHMRLIRTTNSGWPGRPRPQGAGEAVRAGAGDRRRHRHRPHGGPRQRRPASPLRQAHGARRLPQGHRPRRVDDRAQALPPRLPDGPRAAVRRGQGAPGGPPLHAPRLSAGVGRGHRPRLHLLPLGAAPRRPPQHQLPAHRAGAVRRQHPPGAHRPRRAR